MSIQHAYTACLYSISIHYTACPYSMSTQHAYAACLYSMPMHPEASRRSRSECGEDALVVSVMLANNLPKMDLLGECSAYCVLWVDNAPSSGTCVTSTVDRNANPCFNESFQWECSSETSKLYISVWCVPATCVCLCVCVCVSVCVYVLMYVCIWMCIVGLVGLDYCQRHM